MSQAILTALKALDISNDNHWTADGLPRLDTVKMLASDQTLTREAVDSAAPGFTRSTAAAYEAPAVQAEQPPAPPEAATSQGDNGGEPAAPAAAPPQPAANPDLASTPAEAQPGEVDGGSGSAADETSSLEEELAEAEEEATRIREFLDEGNKRLKEAQARADAIRDKLDAMGARDTNADAIQAYLASQRKKGEDRAARMALINESGVNLKELAKSVQRAPIDQAMGRKTDRGTQRPQRLL